MPRSSATVSLALRNRPMPPSTPWTTGRGAFSLNRLGERRAVAIAVEPRRVMPESNPPPSSGADPLFHTTHWSVVLAAGAAGSEQSLAALEQLCRAYWYPVFAYVRRCGHSPHDAEDLAQEFFYRLLDRHYLAQADPRRGRFRNFLLVAVKHFLANEWDRRQALKRGGRVTFISLDQVAGENDAWLAGGESPEQAFARSWALTFLERVLARLRDDLEPEKRAEWFEELKGFLIGDPLAPPYAQVAARLGTSEAAVKMAVQRLRRRFAEVLREEIAHTVAGPEEIDDEIRSLFAAIGG
jgi:RNA polymerase sigma-70 factor (ECF subfamily)